MWFVLADIHNTAPVINPSATQATAPRLEAKALKTFDIPYAELSPHLQEVVRKRVLRDAAEDMLAALKALIEYPAVREVLAPRDSLGSLMAFAEKAIAKAEGR